MCVMRKHVLKHLSMTDDFCFTSDFIIFSVHVHFYVALYFLHDGDIEHNFRRFSYQQCAIAKSFRFLNGLTYHIYLDMAGNLSQVLIFRLQLVVGSNIAARFFCIGPFWMLSSYLSDA